MKPRSPDPGRSVTENGGEETVGEMPHILRREMISPRFNRNAGGRWAVSVTGKQCWLSSRDVGLGRMFLDI